MRERGKTAEALKNNGVFPDCYYTSSSELPCRKHPSASPVGVCPYCLNDRLMNLVCPECGEQRLSSCSCSDFSSGTADVGSVGRMSFLIDNDKSSSEIPRQSIRKVAKNEEVLFLKRSSSSCIEMKKKHKFWKIVGFLRRVHGKKEKDLEAKSMHHIGFDGRSDSWVVDYNHGSFNGNMGISRSRSLCSFRGGMLFGSEDGSYSRSSISAARSSSVNGGIGLDGEPRRSGFEGRKSNFSEAEHRKSGFSETEPKGRRSNFSETELRKSGFSEAEPRRSFLEGRKSNYSETEHRRSGFSESEPRRSCFEGRKSNLSETEPRRSYFDGRRSNFSETEHRKSGFSETEPRRSWFDGRSNFSELEARRSGFDYERSCATDSDGKGMRKGGGATDVDTKGLSRRVLSLKESYFTGGEDSGFIDLKFDLDSRMGEQYYYSTAFGSMRCSEGLGLGDEEVWNPRSRGGGRERGLKKSGRRSFKGWRWMFRQSPHRMMSGNNRRKEEQGS